MHSINQKNNTGRLFLILYLFALLTELENLPIFIKNTDPAVFSINHSPTHHDETEHASDITIEYKAEELDSEELDEDLGEEKKR